MQSPQKFMCFVVLLEMFAIVPAIQGGKPVSDLWSKFETVANGSRSLHQEFEVMQHISSGYVDHVSRYQVVLDFSQGQWREQPLGEGGERIRIFNGEELFMFEAGGKEYLRPKSTIDKDKPLPQPYDVKLDWNKVKEVQQLPCGFSGKDHQCVIIEAPVKPWLRNGLPGEVITMKNGTVRVMADTETGIWLRVHIAGDVASVSHEYQFEVNCNIKQMSYGEVPDAGLFKLPEGSHEVKEIARWNEERFKRELVGKPAPTLRATDIHGATVSLADLKGKTVLIDFWTTWCPPCQSDASSIEKLNQKYGNKNLAIIGVSVDEDRSTVEAYLKKHAHSYPVVLSTENRLPPAYQIGVFPTYLIVAPDGTLVTAEQGDRGFSSLRKALEKAGMQAE